MVNVFKRMFLRLLTLNMLNQRLANTFFLSEAARKHLSFAGHILFVKQPQTVHKQRKVSAFQ